MTDKQFSGIIQEILFVCSIHLTVTVDFFRMLI